MLNSKILKEALTAARKGDKVDLSELTIPWGGGSIAKAEGEGASRIRSVVWSDKSVDEDNDTIEPGGWHLDRFLRSNGPILWAHNNKVLPLGKQANTRVDGTGPTGRLLGDIDFSKENPWAELVLALVNEGVLSQVSVGFRPVVWQWNEERGGLDFIEQRLLEGSIVPVGSNPNAMIAAAQSKSLDMAPMVEWLERCLDDDDIYTASPRKELEVFHKALSPWRKTKGGVVVPKGTPDNININIDVQSSKDAAKAVVDALEAEKVKRASVALAEKKAKVIDDAKTMLGLVVESVKSGELSRDIFDAPLAELGMVVESRGAISWDEAHPNGTPRERKDAEWIACVGDCDSGDVVRAHKDGLCHHRDTSGNVVWAGLAKAMDDLLSGDAKIPEADQRAAYDHLARHYRDDFDEEPPVFRTAGEEPPITAALIEEKVTAAVVEVLESIDHSERTVGEVAFAAAKATTKIMEVQFLRESGRLPV